MPRWLCASRDHTLCLDATRAPWAQSPSPPPVPEAPPPGVREGSDAGARLGLRGGQLAHPVVPPRQQCGLFSALRAWPLPQISRTQTQRDSGDWICSLRTHCPRSRPRPWHQAGAAVLGGVLRPRWPPQEGPAATGSSL